MAWTVVPLSCFLASMASSAQTSRDRGNAYRKAAGLPADFRFHGLRHHFASALVSNGVDLSVVSALLTHKDMGTTQRYAHLAPGVVKAAAQKSADILTPKAAAKPVLRLVE